MDNTQRFTGRAAVYDLYRQRYPAADVLSLLQQWCDLQPHWLVADVGAGTGMLSEVFLENGNPVVAIEPNEEMRSALTPLRKLWPQLRALNGTAEMTSLTHASVDMVAVGRAFHWFNTEQALKEFRRILKPGGWVTVISLGRAKSDTPLSFSFEKLLTEHGTDFNYVRSGYRINENLQTLFARDFHQTAIHTEQRLDWLNFSGQAMSFSMTPREDDPRFQGFVGALKKHFETFSLDGLITVPTTCWISAGRF